MSGYTPVFDSVFTGTLCGQYPDTAAWLFVLALSDRHGVVDVTPQYISSVTGMPVADLLGCIDRFMKPDPGSRTPDNDGRRLELLHPHRPWGWRILNHGLYRERARLASKSAREVADGSNKRRLTERTAAYRRNEDETAEFPHRPPLTASDPLSDLNINKDLNEERETITASATPTKTLVPLKVSRGAIDPEWFLDFKLAYPDRAGDRGWRKAAKAGNARIAQGHMPAEFISGAKRYAAFCDATGKTGTEFVKQAATFLGPDKPFLLPWELPPTKADVRLAGNIDAALEAKRRIFGDTA